MLFTSKQKLVIGGAILFAVLFVVGSYFGSHWYYGDIDPVPEHLLTIEPRPSIVNQEVSQEKLVFGSQDTAGLESSSVAETGELSGGDVVSTPLPDITDDELDALLQDLDESPDEKGDFPEVPDGFPSDLTPIWIEYPNYRKGDVSDHETMYRVLIKLWNQGDHDFVNGVYMYGNGRVYPLYRDVLYVTWDEDEIDEPDGGKRKFRYISSALGTHARANPEDGWAFFTPKEMMTEGYNYKAKYPDLKLVDYDSAGYAPETFLDDDEK